MERKQVEILAPAGSYESMTAAVNAGADAVYIGGSRFGARAYADNPDEETMIKAIDYVHLHGRRLYMTVNTLMKEKELAELDSFLTPYYEAGLDAVIVQDLGAFLHIRDHFPGLPLHVSTQMTVTGKYSASMLKRMGASRVVPARELSLPELKEMYDETGMEIEVFVHGALCYCYSGQCLFSSLIGGRSGNRGRCAQTCRLPFEVMRGRNPLNKKNDRYVLSLKDLCTLDILPEILETGVCSLKIEGRMKSPRYTAGVVSIYRKYVDRYLEYGKEGWTVEERDRAMLLDLFDRGGQTEGYYRKHNGRDMVVLKEKPAFREGNQELFDRLDREYVNREKQEEISGEAWFEAGKAAKLTVWPAHIPSSEKQPVPEVSVTVSGEPVEEAKNAPMDEERIRRQLSRTGGSPFIFRDLSVHVSGNIFVPMQELNRLRREALEKLENEIPAQHHRTAPAETGLVRKEAPEEPRAAGGRPELAALVNTGEQFEAVRSLLSVWNGEQSEAPVRSFIWLASDTFEPSEWKSMVLACHEVSAGCGLMLPRIFRREAERFFLKNREVLLDAGFDRLGAGSMEEPEFAARYFPGLKLTFDHGMYTFNHLAAEAMREMGADRLTVPVELNRREIREAGKAGDLIVYGRLPMMVSAQCIRKTMEGCSRKPEILRLKDRKGKEFPVVNQCRFCCNTIYNSAPLSLLGLSGEVLGLHPEALRLDFTTEDGKETGRVLGEFYREYILGEDAAAVSGDITRGHFRRGIE